MTRPARPGYFRERVLRLEPPRRVPGIDLARALALIGMFAAHLLDQPELVWSDPETWAGVVNGRPSILFATLAGVSLALTDRRTPGEARSATPGADARIAVRAVLIWSLGALLVFWEAPVYVILQAYGILFLLAILFLRLRTPVLLLVAAVAAVLGPYLVVWIDEIPITDAGLAESLSLNLGWNYPFIAWAAFVAAGIVVGRVLRRATAGRSALLLLGGAAFAALGYGVIGPVGDRAIEEGSGASQAWTLAVLQSEPHSTGVGEIVGSGGFAIAVIGLCVLVCRLIGGTPLRWAFWPLRAFGSMPLTAYAVHLLIWIWWIAAEEARTGIEIENPGTAFRELDPFWPMVVWLVVGCGAWAVLIGRGPFEALLMRVSRFVGNLVAGDDEARR